MSVHIIAPACILVIGPMSTYLGLEGAVVKGVAGMHRELTDPVTGSWTFAAWVSHVSRIVTQMGAWTILDVLLGLFAYQWLAWSVLERLRMGSMDHLQPWRGPWASLRSLPSALVSATVLAIAFGLIQTIWVFSLALTIIAPMIPILLIAETRNPLKALRVAILLSYVRRQDFRRGEVFLALLTLIAALFLFFGLSILVLEQLPLSVSSRWTLAAAIEGLLVAVLAMATAIMYSVVVQPEFARPV